jgi:hypothetical protein
MPSPTELLDLARGLSTETATHKPNDAELRRAVSTAYYALFHNVVAAAAQRFMGPGHQNSAGYRILYRGFDHKRMKEICESLQLSKLRDKDKRDLQRQSVSQDIKDFAGVFPDLQGKRHLADYDPSVQLLASDVASLVDSAEVAMQAFDRAPPDEKADILALMMIKTRA